MQLPSDYLERVYAGVLGKVIGVYVGKPFEQWTKKAIQEKFGQIDYYIHDRVNYPLIASDDDISGTFTFLRALEDHGFDPDLTPAQIGETWLNYLIEGKTVLWWGGMGESTEHTAYQRLKAGIPAPESGSIKLNGRVVAEQIGAQIFIDGWGLINPGDPERAADFARRAGSVSHDGEAIYGAQVIAAMVAQAFVESDVNKLIDTAVALIPKDSGIYRLIEDVRWWHSQGADWEADFAKLDEAYGYAKYTGGCHMIPNHGLIVLSLLHGGGDFQKTMVVVNTCGLDTDCNSGNAGCILGVANGLAGLESGPDWRGPVADRLLIPTADAQRCVSDALTEAYHVVNAARSMRGLDPLRPKEGARFHFHGPGAVQGFTISEDVDSRSTLALGNPTGQALEVSYAKLAPGLSAKVLTPTHVRETEKDFGYRVISCPTLVSGQTVMARMSLAEGSDAITAALFVTVETDSGPVRTIRGEAAAVGTSPSTLTWKIPDTDAMPILSVGLELASPTLAKGTLMLDSLTWDGSPELTLTSRHSRAYRGQFAVACDTFLEWGQNLRICQEVGVGMLITGGDRWQDYDVEASVSLHMPASGGIAARVRGLKRYYALLLVEGGIRLVRANHDLVTLAEAPFEWALDQMVNLRLSVQGSAIVGFVDGKELVRAEEATLPAGGIALVVEDGKLETPAIRVGPPR